MKIAGVRELRQKTAELLGGTDPVLVTRHGKVSGLFVPLPDNDRVPLDLRRTLVEVLGQHIARALDTRGVSEEEILADFDAHRRGRR